MNTNTALPVEIRNVVISTTLASIAARVGSVQEFHAACRRAVKAVTGASRVARGDGGLIDALCDEVRADPESFSTASVTTTTPVNVDMSATNGLLAQIIALLQTLLTVCVKGFASGNQLPEASEKVIDAEFLLPEAKTVPVTSDVRWVQVQNLPEATRLPALPAAKSTSLALRN